MKTDNILTGVAFAVMWHLGIEPIVIFFLSVGILQTYEFTKAIENV